MRVVIVGAGKLGYSLAEYLAQEQHEVIVVESDEDRREIIKNNLDVLTIDGNGASPLVLTDPDIKAADLLVACTDSDEVNMIVCMMAKKVGIQQTIARIRSNEYTGSSDEFIRKMTEIDLVLNPERIIALEISRILLTPFALDVDDFANGKVRLFESRLLENSPFVNIPLHSLPLPKDILVAGIFRQNKLIIPRGNDILLPRDSVFFVGLNDTIQSFEKEMDIALPKIERAMIIGAGRIGCYLGPILEQSGLSVKIIDKNIDRCEHASTLLKTGIALCGDGTNIELLTQEGVAEADVVICLTEDDRLNLLLALLAKHLGAKKTIVKTARSEYVALMEKVGVDIVISSRLLSVGEILSFVNRGGLVGVSFLEGAKAQAIEIIVQENNPLTGIPLRNAKLDPGCLVCALVRDEQALVPNGNTVLLPGDRVIFFVATESVNQLMTFFEGE